MKIAFDVDVLAKQMPIRDYVRKVADWGYKYIEQSPHPRINPFYKHPLFSKEKRRQNPGRPRSHPPFGYHPDASDGQGIPKPGSVPPLPLDLEPFCSQPHEQRAL